MSRLNRNDIFYYGLSRLLLVYLIFVFIMACFRLFFLFYYADQSIFLDYKLDLILAMFIGAKYDTLVLSYIFLVPYLLVILSGIWGSLIFSNFVNLISRLWLFFGLNTVLLLLACDLGFYSYFQDHLNVLFFGFLEDDTEAVLISIWKDYPVEYALLGAFIFMLLHWGGLKKIFKKFDRKTNSFFHAGYIKLLLGMLISFILFVGGIRGGYSDLVLAPKYADFSKSEFVNQVALNGIVTFEKAVKMRMLYDKVDHSVAKTMGYEGRLGDAYERFLGEDLQGDDLLQALYRKVENAPSVDSKKLNIVVIIMESFGSFWLQYHNQDFNLLGELEKHFQDDIVFTNFLPGDNGTIGSLMTVAMTVPPIAGAKFLSEGKYMQMKLESSAQYPFAQQGLYTRFVYGGKLGWRGIGKYFSRQGYNEVDGEQHIVDALNLKGKYGSEWGIYDEYFFDYIFQKLTEKSQGQFILALSTTNHPPYEVNSDYQALSLKVNPALQQRITREKGLVHERFLSYQYSNNKLGQFISKIKNSSLAENTIIAVTGDHNFWSFITYDQGEAFIKYKVPFYLYVPASMRPKEVNPNVFGSHEDIMPTLYQLALNNGTTYLSFGHNLLSSIPRSYALNSAIWGNEQGVLYNDKAYVWSDIPGGKIESIPLTNSLDVEAQKSILSIVDYYLREIFKKNTHFVLDSDQQL